MFPTLRLIPTLVESVAFRSAKEPSFAERKATKPTVSASVCIRSWLVLSGILLAGCANQPEVKPLPPPEVIVSEVKPREVVERDSFTGRTEAIPTVEIRSRVQGYLQKILFEDGQIVEKGQPLYELDPRPFERARDEARAQLKVYEAQKVAAEKEVARLEELKQRGGASQRQLDKAVADVGSLNASIEATQEQVKRHELDLTYAKITAPIRGQIDRTLHQVGDLIETMGSQSLLTTIRAEDPIYVNFDISQRQYLLYQKMARQHLKEPDKNHIKEAKIPVFLTLVNGDRYPHTGYIDFVSNSLDPSTGTLRVRARFPNPDRLLLSGQEVTALVEVRSKFKALQVAEQALGTDQGDKFVYVVDADNKVKYQRVKTGSLIEGLRVITEGLQPGDKVVVVGVLRVRPGLEVKPVVEPMPGLAEEEGSVKEKTQALEN
jgi:RND family efflux transporter MFP subunit